MSRKTSQIEVHDAKNKGAMGYRVKFVGKNSEILMTSEVLESVAAVNKNLVASIWCGSPTTYSLTSAYGFYYIEDCTKGQKFIRYGAKSGLKVKPKSKKK